MILGDIDGNKATKAHRSGYSTHSVRPSDPINYGLLGVKIRESVMEGLLDSLLDSNAPVTGVHKGNIARKTSEHEC